MSQVAFVSATPADYELENCQGAPVELIVRPTGLIDPEVHVRPATAQVDDLQAEIQDRISRNERVLVTTLTKRMAEDLSEYFTDLGLQVRYLHSDIKTMERMDIIRDLRLGEFDVLIGINLLREGLDIPEVTLVAILDADKEGFLRSTRSLIQTFGRAARNVRGTVILYADRVTASMQRALDETKRRREIQKEYNRIHNVTPRSIQKDITTVFDEAYAEATETPVDQVAEAINEYGAGNDLEQIVENMENEMREAASDLDFERAAVLRDRIKMFKQKMLFEGG